VLVFFVIGGLGLALLLVSIVAADVVDGLFSALDTDIVSGAAIAAFLAAFGFVGALVLNASGSTAWAVVAGLAAGAVLGAGTAKASQVLMRGGDEATVRTASLVGATGTVVEAIPTVGLGQVTVTVAGHITRLNARADSPLEPGTPITIIRVLSPTAVVVEAH
jgi:membrane protein implicated in regulation of membrane protease activity